MKSRRRQLHEDTYRRLGLVPDSVIAKELGVTRQRVQQIRRYHGIGPRHPRIDWTEIDPWLGTGPDATVAARFDLSKAAVMARRRVLGVPRYRLIGPIHVEHGTRYTYTEHKCRCGACRRANADAAIARYYRVTRQKCGQ